MHPEEITVSFPLFFILYPCQGVKRITEIRFKGLFQVIDILHGVVGILVEVQVIQTIVLFRIENTV
ncbi:hypothetical protein ES705_46024 [subsurface metagenome]